MVLEVVRALGRRWYVVMVGLLLTSGIVVGAHNVSPPEYHARGLVLLLPSQSAVGKGGNPFLQLSGLEQPAGIVVAYFSGAPAQAEVKAISPTAAYEVGIDDSTRGPVIAVDVTAKSAAETLVTLDHLVTQIPVELTRLQQQVSAPADAVIGSMALTVDKKADVDRAGTLRAMIAALVFGLVATGVTAVAVDSLLQRRKMREPRRGSTAGSRARRSRRGAERHARPSSSKRGIGDNVDSDPATAQPSEPLSVGHRT